MELIRKFKQLDPNAHRTGGRFTVCGAINLNGAYEKEN
jgi:hypothetical protein